VPAEDLNGERSSQGVPTGADHALDSLARGLANGTVSRRKALRLLGAVLLGGTLASIPGVAWAKPKPGKPKPGKCKGKKVDLSTDPNNCGTCGNVCLSGETCCNGGCISAASLLTDVNNCGACGNVCGGCPQCGSPYKACCNGTCTTLDTLQNCGTCGTTCPEIENMTCRGAMGCRCFGPLVHSAVCDGKCTNLEVDNNNCMACGNVCPEGTRCRGHAGCRPV
jgi:hypothetical protein